jgi:hypothetical protein
MLSPAWAMVVSARNCAAWPEAGGHRRHPAFERRDALFEDVGGRIHDAGVDVAELLQREQRAPCSESLKV